MKSSLRAAIVALALGALGLPAVSLGGTSEVFRVQTTINGVIERGSPSNTVIQKVMITVNDFINLAFRRVLGTPVSQNEALALANDCTADNLRLIVYDKSAASNLLTIGTLSNLTTATSTRKRYDETMTQVSIPYLSDGTNGISGGSFYFHGTSSITSNGCPTRFGGQLTGYLGTVFPFVETNIFCTNVVIGVTTNCPPITNIINTVEGIVVIIPRTAINTGKSIGQLIEP